MDSGLLSGILPEAGGWTFYLTRFVLLVGAYAVVCGILQGLVFFSDWEGPGLAFLLALFCIVGWWLLTGWFGLGYEALIARYGQDLAAPADWGGASFTAGLVGWVIGLWLGFFWGVRWSSANTGSSGSVPFIAAYTAADDLRYRLKRMSGQKADPPPPYVG